MANIEMNRENYGILINICNDIFGKLPSDYPLKNIMFQYAEDSTTNDSLEYIIMNYTLNNNNKKVKIYIKKNAKNSLANYLCDRKTEEPAIIEYNPNSNYTVLPSIQKDFEKLPKDNVFGSIEKYSFFTTLVHEIGHVLQEEMGITRHTVGETLCEYHNMLFHENKMYKRYRWNYHDMDELGNTFKHLKSIEKPTDKQKTKLGLSNILINIGKNIGFISLADNINQGMQNRVLEKNNRARVFDQIVGQLKSENKVLNTEEDRNEAINKQSFAATLCLELINEDNDFFRNVFEEVFIALYKEDPRKEEIFNSQIIKSYLEIGRIKRKINLPKKQESVDLPPITPFCAEKRNDIGTVVTQQRVSIPGSGNTNQMYKVPKTE